MDPDLSILPCACAQIYIYLSRSIHPSVHLTIYPSNYLSVHPSTEIYSKKLAHMIVRAGKPEVYRAGSRLETQGRVDTEPKQGIFKSNAVSPLKQCWAHTPCLPGLGSCGFSDPLSVPHIPTLPFTPFPDMLTPLLPPWMPFTWLMGEALQFVRWTDPGSSPAALFLVDDPE